MFEFLELPPSDRNEVSARRRRLCAAANFSHPICLKDSGKSLARWWPAKAPLPACPDGWNRRTRCGTQSVEW